VIPADDKPAPERINTLEDLAYEFERLRRRAARPGQLRMSVRDIAARANLAPSMLHPYLRGRRLCPADTYDRVLRALGVTSNQLRPWLDAWERIADTTGPHLGTREAAGQTIERRAEERAAIADATDADSSGPPTSIEATHYRRGPRRL